MCLILSAAILPTLNCLSAIIQEGSNMSLPGPEAIHSWVLVGKQSQKYKLLKKKSSYPASVIVTNLLLQVLCSKSQGSPVSWHLEGHEYRGEIKFLST